MPQPKKQLTIKRSGTVSLWKVQFDSSGVKFASSSRTLDVAPGQHVVQWFVRGAPGTTYTVEVTEPAEAAFKFTATLDEAEKDVGFAWIAVKP